MTGPEHRDYAETLLDMASDAEHGSSIEQCHTRNAQAHATVAVAAAIEAQNALLTAAIQQLARFVPLLTAAIAKTDGGQ